MATKITDVQIGDQLLIRNRLGLAMVRGRNKDGSQFWFVPNRSQKTGLDDLIQYFGLVGGHDVDAKILTLTITPWLPTWTGHQYDTRSSLPGVVHYTALSKVQRLSKDFTPGQPESVVHRTGLGPRPTTQAIGTAFRPFRTLEDILIC